MRLTRHPSALTALSLALAFVVLLISPAHQRITFWLRGSYYWSYHLVLVPLLFAFMLVRVRRREQANRYGMILYGGLAGYAAGIVAHGLQPLFHAGGVHELLLSYRFTTIDAWAAFLWFPIRLWSWLLGILTGLSIVLIEQNRR